MKGTFIKLWLISAFVAVCGNIAAGSIYEEVPASALFTLDQGIENLKADFKEGDYFLTSKVTWGSGINPDGTGDGTDPDRFYAGQDNKGYKQLWFTPDSFESSTNDANIIKFTLQPRFGLTFVPDKVSLKTTRYSTDGGRLDISWINPDGSQVPLAKGVVPCRDNSSPAILEWKADIDTSRINAAPGPCGLAISIYSLDKGKHVGISNVTIEGTISGEEREIPVLKSFIANGITYNAEEIFEPDGDKYTATIELFSSQPMISADNPVTSVTADTGNLGNISYKGDSKSCEITIPMKLNDETINYVATFIRKPIYTITYFNTDGSSMGSQQIEKDTPIGQFDVEYSKAIVKDGYMARGWFANPALDVKAQTTDIITRDINLYVKQVRDTSNNGVPTYTKEGNWYFVKPGDIWSFLDALEAANVANADPDATRAYIFLPDGTYDMADKVLTKITGHNISLIGQSMEGTRVVNAPHVMNEGIGTTATFLNESNGLYIQDITIQNALDYYKAGSAGRAVVLQDKGTNTICKNVALLSYQDTYYSNNPDGLFYFDGSKVAGTVDFFCGGGTMFMENSIIQVEKRNANGKGECTITAPATPAGKTYGYVFSNCTIMNYAEKYNLGRAWQKEPRCAFINTKVNDNKMSPGRWTPGGMNTVAKEFVEYNTTDLDGNVVSPDSKVIEFTKDVNKNKMETILTAEQAAEFDIEKVFPDWQPRVLAGQIPPPVISFDSKVISWSPIEGASGYAIFRNGNLVTITTDCSYPLENIGSTVIDSAFLHENDSSHEDCATSIKSTVSHENISTPIKSDKISDIYTIRSINSMGALGPSSTPNHSIGVN